MATTRKRTSGFSEKPQQEVEECQEVEQFLEEAAQETFEEVSKAPEPVVAFIPQEIIPTDDAGPRFVEEPTPVAPVVKSPAPKLQPPPKRHPRNIPKFSRFK